MNESKAAGLGRTNAVRPARGRQAVAGVIYALLVCILMALVASGTAQARTDDARKPVLAIHGYGQFEPLQIGVPCPNQWWAMKSILAWQGFGDIDGVAYYATDFGCEVDLIAKSRQLGAPIDGHSTFVEIGRVLNAYVYDNYTSKGKAVDLVGHSMGGLIARAAVLGGQLGTPGFRPIDVEDAVTLGTPHLGTPITLFCPLIGPQCAAIETNSPEMTWMRSVGNPQGAHGTDWTVGAALADELVPKPSAWGMDVDTDHKLQTMAPEHLSMTTEPITVNLIGRALKLGTR